jgi:hypothetical protein
VIEPGLGAYLAAIDILIVAQPTCCRRAAQIDCTKAHEIVMSIRADPTYELLPIPMILLALLSRSP